MIEIYVMLSVMDFTYSIQVVGGKNTLDLLILKIYGIHRPTDPTGDMKIGNL